MIICFNGLKVIDCTIENREKHLARTLLRSEDTEIVATLPYEDDENSFRFRPKASESFTIILSTKDHLPKNGVLRKLEVSSFSVDADNIDESSTRINAVLVNRKDLLSHIEFNWCKDLENYNEILDNLEVGNTLYVSMESENNSSSATEVGR